MNNPGTGTTNYIEKHSKVLLLPTVTHLAHIWRKQPVAQVTFPWRRGKLVRYSRSFYSCSHFTHGQ